MRILLTLLLLLSTLHAQQLTQIQLNTQIPATLGPKDKAYYSIVIPSTLKPNSVLIATVDVVEDHTSPEVYMSSSVQFPDYSNSDENCLADRIGSCTTANLTAGGNMYISVFCLDGCNYTIFVNVEPTIPISINTRSKIDFNTSSSGILTFVLNDSLSQLTILAEEQDFYASNHFRMLIGKGFIPSENNYSLACIDIGPYRKAIKLSQDNLEPNVTYYLLIQAEQNTSLILDTQGYLPGQQGTIFPNTTVFDYLNDDQNYTISYKLTDQSVQQPLYIRLKSYSGYGVIRVLHCNEHEFFYYDSDGQNQEIRISPKERKECQSNNMLMIQNIEIQVIPVMSTYSFSIGSHESLYTSQVRFAQYESGALGAGEYINYTTFLYIQEPADISLNVWFENGQPTFILSLCDNVTAKDPICTTIQTLQIEGNIIFPYDPKNCTTQCYLQLNVVGGTEQSQFSFIYRASGYRMKLDDGSVDIGFISMNEYIYYNLTLTNTTNVKSVTIKVVEYSGEVSLIGSKVVTNPKIQDATASKDVIMNWNDVITFTGKPEQPIYLSVFGATQAVYKITVLVNRQQNTPSIYTSLQEQASNQFFSKGEPVLVKYAPSVNPYYLTFYPYVPSCVIYGSSLPLGTQCMTLPEEFTGQLYMNITGVIGERLKIIVGSQTFLLYSNNPLFLNCDQTCAQIIRVKIQNGSVGVMHSGYGRLYDHSTNRSINNGQITLTCPDSKSVCLYTLSAELNWGEMIVSLSSDDIFQISWYPQPVSLQKLPKKLVYKLPKQVPTVITIISKIASVDLYANIQMLDQQKGHHLGLSYPNKTFYDFKVQSDFFKRTLTLQITSSLQKQLGCFSDNQYCVLTLTVFLNDHCRYAHIVSDEIFVISASSYTMVLQENVKYLMEDISQLEYYQYRSVLPSNFTFYIEPISNCKPVLIYSDEIDYPTDQIKKISSYHSISITNKTKSIVGVISQTDCLYNMMVLIDNISSNHRVLIEGFPETVNLPKNSTTYFYYQSPNKIPFQISGTVSSLPIYVLEVPEGQDPSLYLPKKDYSNYSAPHLPLEINNTQPSSYMIAIVNTFPTNITTSLLITQEGLQIIMMHNRIYQQKIEQNNIYRFRYYSSNSFLVVFVTSSGSYTVNVSSYPDLNITKLMNDTSSDSSIKVQSDGILKPYWIQIEAHTMGYFSIEIIDIGGESAPSLSAGLPYFDAFTENPQTNCYKYKGDPTNNEPIRVSLVYRQEFIKTLQASNASLKSLELAFSYKFKSYTDSKQSANLKNTLNFALGVTFSLEQKYGQYLFCFQNTANQLLDESYYVILASKDLQFLIPSLSFFVSDSNVQLDKYELISTEPKTIIAELMNCEGETQLTATSNYSQISDGVTTQIHHDFKHGPYFAGVVNITKGYYYLGAKAVKPNSSYLLRFTTFNQNQKIVLSEMNIVNNSLKWHGSGDFLVVTADALQCKQKCNLTKYVRYYLYLSRNASSLNKRTRCGLKDSNSVYLYQYIQTNLSQKNISFKVPIELIPSEFALTVRAEAIQIPDSTQPRGVYYFYNTTQMIQVKDIEYDDQFFSFEAMILTMIVMLLALVFFFLFICKRYKVGFFRNSRAVQFEVTDFNNNSRDPQPEINTQRNDNQNNQIELREVQRRNVDDGVAYGEFIDQSRI